MFSPRQSGSDVSSGKAVQPVKPIRPAVPQEAPVLARLINDAFKVEAFFKIGDRTSDDEVLRMMGTGQFLVLEKPRGTIAGCVYLRCQGDRAYFGMLSIEPSRQGGGLGRQLIDAVEARCRERGCRYVDIHIVNLREELPGFYRRLGYVESGTLPFTDMDRATRPCHFIVMTKSLG
ncbi:MAG TPA: GNAT family N-acetyltransferase [Vicinamibacterales bacterium]|jgi:N-acetylglutamate synthase-like GNAT family acetyltransferase